MRVGTAKDAAFINQVIKDLHATKALPDEAVYEVQDELGFGAGFVNDKMLATSWKKVTGEKAEGPLFRQFRARVFFTLLMSRTDLDETKLRGNAANALRALASTTPQVKTESTFVDDAIGAKVNDVDVSVTNQRIYLRGEGSPRGAYIPQRGLAVLYKRDDGWELSWKDKDGKEHDLMFFSDRANLDPDIMRPEELKTLRDAGAALRGLLRTYLGLGDIDDFGLSLKVDSEDLDPKTEAFARDALKTIDKLDRRRSRPIAPPAARDVSANELSEDALKTIAAFRDGELNFGVSDDISRRAAKKRALKASVEELVDFVANDGASTWALDLLEEERGSWDFAHSLVHGLSQGHNSGLNDAHFSRKKVALRSAPKALREWVKANVRDAEMLISVTGEHVRIPELKVGDVVRVSVDGEHQGYVVHCAHGRGRFSAAVFDTAGKLLDDGIGI